MYALVMAGTFLALRENCVFVLDVCFVPALNLIPKRRVEYRTSHGQMAIIPEASCVSADPEPDERVVRDR